MFVIFHRHGNIVLRLTTLIAIGRRDNGINSMRLKTLLYYTYFHKIYVVYLFLQLNTKTEMYRDRKLLNEIL